MDEQSNSAWSWLHFRLPAVVYVRIRALADRERRSISQMARVLIEDALEARERKNGSH
jgi:predicted DNA-binding protein